MLCSADVLRSDLAEVERCRLLLGQRTPVFRGPSVLVLGGERSFGPGRTAARLQSHARLMSWLQVKLTLGCPSAGAQGPLSSRLHAPRRAHNSPSLSIGCTDHSSACWSWSKKHLVFTLTCNCFARLECGHISCDGGRTHHYGPPRGQHGVRGRGDNSR